jgi:hypothetical protein
LNGDGFDTFQQIGIPPSVAGEIIEDREARDLPNDTGSSGIAKLTLQIGAQTTSESLP